MESASGGGGRVVIDGTVAIVNGGPRAVEFVGASKVADVMVWGHQRIAPAGTGWFAVSATITCAEDASTRPLPVELPVVTEDGVRRTVTVQLQLMGSRWHDLVVQACALAR